VTLECGYRIDLVVEREVVIEVKAVEKLLPVHLAQVATYLKLTGYPVGLLVNFHTASLRQGLRRLTLK
jgi:GxxExxY protein